uniref:Gelsolin-like domain-containing protein n=1 Tax=Rhabditophanes sp. KR3021 TaxID=114890 RepID=A0AC35TG63_9BILA
MDPALKDMGKVPGMEVWRINKFKLEKIPKADQGMFYRGDSYIILNTKYGGAWDVHFWLGSETTIDERGTAAYKAVEIDDSLGGLPVQYRETEGHESALFLSYFKEGIVYNFGGHQTGFTHIVDDLANFKNRLFQCKGKRNVRCTQVDLKVESLNLGDVFILDCGKEIFAWLPPQSGRLEKIKGIELAEVISKSERHNRCVVHILDSDYDTDPKFWSYFGGLSALRKVKKAEEGGHDENYWRTNRQSIALYKASDASGQMKVTKVSEGGLDKSKLDSNDAFIVDAVKGGLYVWIGKNCTAGERAKSMIWAEQYLKQNKRPEWTQVTRVLEGAEPYDFIQWFTEWSEAKKSKGTDPKLYQCSDESGKLVVEEIRNFTQTDLDGDDVMILDAGNNIYVWIGMNANKKERDAAEGIAKKYLETDSVPRSKHATTEIVFQTKETVGFKKFFKNWDDKMFKDVSLFTSSFNFFIFQEVRSVANVRKLMFK